ncbi:MAG: restriction endonuclease subunit S [Candidatus Sericytochromatia bacterium]|nr:restriction endonuclease subunit S [Candidatus Sericytochromatia bacterium]
MSIFLDKKDSEIDWIGLIPKDWSIKKLKEIAIAITGITYSPDDVVDNNASNSILVLRSSNIQNSKICFEDNVFVNQKISKKHKTKVGDILICSRNGSRHLLGKNIIIDKNGENLTFGAFTTVLRSKYNKYVQYFLSSGVFDNILNSSSSTINQLTIRDLNNVEIPFPPLTQQTAIVNYLDKETSKIDKKIYVLEQKYKKLEEYKQSIIFEIVTKGLDKNVAMKDSGIEWMGEVPNHWEVKRVKEIAKWQIGFTPDTKKSEYYDGTDDWITIRDMDGKFIKESKNKINGSMFPKSWITPSNSLLFSFKLSIGQVAFNEKEVFTNEAICSFSPKSKVNLNYFYYSAPVFIVKNAKKNIYNADLLNQELISSALVLVPTKEDQITIANYLDIETSKIDIKKEIIKKKIALLKEYKQTIIYEAVTGKIEIL